MIRRIVKIVIGFFVAIGLAIGGLTAAWLHGMKVPLASGATWMTVTKLAVADNGAAPNGNFNILFIGSDFRPGVGGARGDALHLITINPSLHAGTILDIPRDTCFNGDKINAANVGPNGNPTGQAQAVSTLTGIPINYVFEVNFEGFTSLIDDIGGITVNVPTQMHDSYSGAYFSPGPIHMSGDQALRFSRDRHDFPSSDLVRTVNQGSLLLDALRDMQHTASSAPGEFKLLASLGRHARIEGIGLKDLYRLGRVADKLDGSKVRNIEFPTNGGNCLSTAGSAGSLMADIRDDGVLESH